MTVELDKAQEKLDRALGLSDAGAAAWAVMYGRDLIDRVRELEKTLREADISLDYVYMALEEISRVETTAKIRRLALRVTQDRIRAALGRSS